MAKADMKLPYTVFAIGMVIAGLYLLSVFVPGGIMPLNQTGDNNTTDNIPEDALDVKFQITVRDMLDSSQTPTGSLKVYDPDDPGVLIESITLSSGTGTSAQTYKEGRALFVKYVPAATTTWFEYGMTFNVPETSSPDAGQTLTVPGGMAVYHMGDVEDNSTNKDVAIQKDYIDVWDTYVTLGAATDAFDPQNDDGATLSVRLSNEDTNEAYGDPRSWTDYSEPIAAKRDKASYLIVNFDLSGSSNVYTSVEDYDLRFTSNGGAQWLKFGGDMALILPLDDEHKCAVYHTSSGITLDQLDGKDIVLEAIFDFSSMSGTDWSDEIDIEVSIAVNYALDYAIQQTNLAYESFNTGSAAHVFGELNSAWSYDCSIG